MLPTDTVDDTTTRRMIEAALARNAKPDVDSVALALLDARFAAFEITMRINSVIAGLRAIRGKVTTPTLDVA
jgi:hypothetical protein